MSTPRFSVVIPVYQAEAYVAEAVASVHAQEERSLEVIVVDDGSTDGSAAVARGLPGVRLLQRENGGIAAARNTGIEAARGEYLAFLDADDRWAPGALAVRHDLLRAHPEAHMAFGRVEQFVEGDAGADARTRPDVARGLLAGAMLLRRADFLRVGLFDERYRAGEFLDWYGRAEEAGLTDAHAEQVVLERRVHQHNTVRDIALVHRCYARIIHARLKRRKTPSDG